MDPEFVVEYADPLVWSRKFGTASSGIVAPGVGFQFIS